MLLTFVDFLLVVAEDVETKGVLEAGRYGAGLPVVHFHDGEEGAEDFGGQQGI